MGGRKRERERLKNACLSTCILLRQTVVFVVVLNSYGIQRGATQAPEAKWLPKANAMNDINLYHDELLLIICFLLFVEAEDKYNGKKY